MITEETLLAKLRNLPKHEREQLLRRIDEWIAQNVPPQPADIRRAIAAVQDTWASLPLNRKTLRWVAEDKELEYDLG